MEGSNIKINDMSVSRSHGTLKLIEENVYLNDNDSKFGILIEVKEDVKLLATSAFTFQVGANVITLLNKMPRVIVEKEGVKQLQ